MHQTTTRSNGRHPSPGQAPASPKVAEPAVVPTAGGTTEYVWLKPSEVLIDPEVQRRYDAAHANRIARDYDPVLFGLGHVSLRADGHYYVMDAQHRCNAARIAGKADLTVLFQVYRGLTREQEAAKFVELNSHKKSVKALDNFRLCVKAGHPIHCDVNKIVESFGLRVAGWQREGGICAVVCLLNIYEGKIGIRPASLAPSSPLPKGQLLSRTLHVLHTAWAKDSNAYDATLLRGVSGFLHRHGTDVDGHRLGRALAKSGTAMATTGNIKSYRASSRKSPNMAALEYIETIYNRRSGRGRRVGAGA